MPDTQIHPTGTVPAPADYAIPGSAELLLKMVYATFNGSGASSSFKPCLRIISDAGSVVGEAVADTTIAAGASADVTWFPHLAGAVATATGVTPVVAYGLLFPSLVPDVPAGGSAFVSFGQVATSDATKIAWAASGGNPNVELDFKRPAKGYAILMATCAWPAGKKIDCRILSPDGFDLMHDGYDSMSGYDFTAAGHGGPQLQDITMMDFNLSNADVPVKVRLTNSDAAPSAPTDVQFTCIYFPGVAA